MVHRPDLKVCFVHSECSLDKPQVVVVGNHFFIGQLGVGYISFETIPSGILLECLKVDTYGCLAFKTEVFVIAPMLICFLVSLPDLTLS